MKTLLIQFCILLSFSVVISFVFNKDDTVGISSEEKDDKDILITASETEEPDMDSGESEEFDDEFFNNLPEGPDENPKCEHAAEWPILYPTCAGLHQSPINIRVDNVKAQFKPVPPLCWDNYDAVPLTTNLFNAGHTIQMTGVWRDGETPTISCGVLGDNIYQFAQWHCHWARNNLNGSDHTFNGKPYPMECHFVHFKKSLGTFQNAALQPDGIVVVAYLFEISPTDTMPNDILGRAVQTLVKRDNVTVMPLPLGVYAPVFADNYVTYHGSLTTPPCSESVIWIINIKAQNITTSLMKKYRCVAKNSDCLTNNFRIPQEVNGRDIILVPDRNLLS